MLLVAIEPIGGKPAKVQVIPRPVQRAERDHRRFEEQEDRVGTKMGHAELEVVAC